MSRPKQRRQRCSRKGRSSGAKTLEVAPHRGQGSSASHERHRRLIEREERQRGKAEIRSQLHDHNNGESQ